MHDKFKYIFHLKLQLLQVKYIWGNKESSGREIFTQNEVS